MYYLQSRYYDPEIGRFINADAFASTGQGILGNNMFAYCNNNPDNCCDETGHKSKKIALPTCLDPEGNDPWNELPHNREPENLGRKGDEIIFDFIASDGLGEAALNIPMGARKAKKGIDKIKHGFNIVLLPIPTATDEIIGLGLIVTGSIQLIFSTKQLFCWAEGFE